MIKEAIQFIDEYEINDKIISKEMHIEEIANTYPKIAIINSKLNDKNEIQLQGDPILLIDEKKDYHIDAFQDMRSWLSENQHNLHLPHLDFDTYINAMADKNKCVGSKQGLMSFSLFHFYLRNDYLFRSNQKNFIFFKKINKHKFGTDVISFIKDYIKNEKLLNSLNNKNGIRKIYTEAFNRLIKKFNLSTENIKSAQSTKLLNKDEKELNNVELNLQSDINNMIKNLGGTHVYLKLYNYENLVNKILDLYLTLSLFIRKKTIKKGICPICNQETNIGVPSPFNTAILHEKKPFNMHLTKRNQFNMQICIECIKKLNNFDKFLSKHKIGFFPLFIKNDYRREEINYLKSGNNKNFFNIIEQIIKISKSQTLDFILLHKSSNILYYNYVDNYKLKLGNFKHYFSDYESNNFTLRHFKTKIEDKKMIGLRQYFGTLQRTESYRKYLFYKYREKIFDQIYRNQQNLMCSDIKEIIEMILDHKIKNKEIILNKKNKEYVRNELLDFYLNSHLYSKNLDRFVQNGGRNMLDEIRIDKENILTGEIPKLDSEEKFGYFLGQLVYYLIEQSNASNKMDLLTPILACQSKESLERIVLEKYLEKYGRELSDYKDYRHLLIAETLDYLGSHLKKPFSEIKMYFYIGFFDDNIFFQKRGS